MESAVIDLPDPDSPAMQSVSPAATSKDSPSTTVRRPSSVATSTKVADGEDGGACVRRQA